MLRNLCKFAGHVANRHILGMEVKFMSMVCVYVKKKKEMKTEREDKKEL
jgi:hypothetical protein